MSFLNDTDTSYRVPYDPVSHQSTAFHRRSAEIDSSSFIGARLNSGALGLGTVELGIGSLGKTDR